MVDALACPECGSDAETGWSEDTLYDGLDLPEPEYGEQEGGLNIDWKGVAVKGVAAGLLGLILLFVLMGLW